jgi:hypothetical protein
MLHFLDHHTRNGTTDNLSHHQTINKTAKLETARIIQDLRASRVARPAMPPKCPTPHPARYPTIRPARPPSRARSWALQEAPATLTGDMDCPRSPLKITVARGPRATSPDTPPAYHGDHAERSPWYSDAGWPAALTALRTTVITSAGRRHVGDHECRRGTALVITESGDHGMRAGAGSSAAGARRVTPRERRSGARRTSR